MTAVAGRLVEIDGPTANERGWIFDRLSEPEIYGPLGLMRPPERASFDQGFLDFSRKQESHREAVRLHVVRLVGQPGPVGFFIDFGWDSPQDTTRELDLALPSAASRRRASVYLDAMFTVGGYMFFNHFAKRLRWRVPARGARSPRRFDRLGARLLQTRELSDPETGIVQTYYFYEFARADFEALGKRCGFDPLDAEERRSARVWRPQRHM